MQALGLLHEACQPLLSDVSSDSEDDDGNSLASSRSSDAGSSSEGDCLKAWALPASAAANDVGWTTSLLPTAPRLRSHGSGMKLRSRLLLLACMLCMVVALGAAVVTVALLPVALTPLERDAGEATATSMRGLLWPTIPLCSACTCTFLIEVSRYASHPHVGTFQCPSLQLSSAPPRQRAAAPSVSSWGAKLRALKGGCPASCGRRTAHRTVDALLTA